MQDNGYTSEIRATEVCKTIKESEICMYMTLPLIYICQFLLYATIYEFNVYVQPGTWDTSPWYN